MVARFVAAGGREKRARRRDQIALERAEFALEPNLISLTSAQACDHRSGG